MADDFKYDKEDENKLVQIANEINLPLLGFASMYRAASPSLEFALDTARASISDYRKEFAEEGEELESLALGEQIFRRYEELKDLAAIAVITAEAALVAEERSYTFRMLTPEEIESAQASVEDLEAYKQLVKARSEGQRTANKNLKVDANKLSQGIYTKLEKKNQVSIVTQMPAGVFESSDKTQYLVFIQQSRLLDGFHIVSDDKITLINDLLFYNPNSNVDEAHFFIQFKD